MSSTPAPLKIRRVRGAMLKRHPRHLTMVLKLRVRRQENSVWSVFEASLVGWKKPCCPVGGLTPLDYFLWGYVKSLVYADKPQTLDHLEDNIRHVIADIRPQMLEKVIENRTSRLDYIRASRGSPMPEIIFKK
ncbi:hypothetical protein TNCV_3625371 [Trichonephila clavipes]|nr:hypothetical protein TNCV_3625371 [Trichonephila clavipes]